MFLKKKLLFAASVAVLTVTSSALAELEVKPYGAAQYRYRGRMWNASAEDSSASSYDQLNQVAWMAGLKAKIDDQVSFQFQIGNDWVAGESVTWMGKSTLGGRISNNAENFSTINNMYVHLAYARWNPGYIYVDAGIIPLASNGALDLLERSLNSGSYNETAFWGWTPHTNNGLAAVKLGAPVLKDDIKMAAELTVSVIDQRTQNVTEGKDIGIFSKEPNSNPTSFFVMFNLPTAVGDFKITPELIGVSNRNYNRELEEGDHEIIGGLSASYKVNDGVSVSLFGGYGNVSNDKSKAGAYGAAGGRSVDKTPDNVLPYNSVGMQFGAGATVKAGPGSFGINVRYGNSCNDKTEKTKTDTNINNIFALPSYTWNIHPNFMIMPRWWFNLTTYDKDRGGVKTKMENRPELIIGGSF